MSVPKSQHKVYIYKNDFNSLCAETFKHQDIETGGNLFGLWTTTGSAVIHLVLGPGQNCRRTTTSFHQDIEYMKRVGNFVNEEYMLCHIGEWHSHHRLSLSRPSSGDEHTVHRNFPQGVTKFLVIIANITGSGMDTAIELSPYFFTHGGERYEIAEKVVLDMDGPFSSNEKILKQIKNGNEKRSENTSTMISSHDGKYPRESPRNSSVQHHGNTCPTRVETHKQRSSNCYSTTPGLHASSSQATREEPMDTNGEGLYPPRDYDNATSVTCQNNPTLTNGNQSRDETTASDLETVLKKISDALEKWFGGHPESEFKFQTSKHTPGSIEIKFKHNGKFWMVQFPPDFPTKCAKLFCSYGEESLRHYQCFSSPRSSLNDEVSILLAIKTECCGFGSRCNVCEKFTRESLSQSNLDSMNKHLLDSVGEISREITSIFDTATLNVRLVSENYFEITFQHNLRYFVVQVPIKFPKEPAKVYEMLYEESSQRNDVLLFRQNGYGPQPLVTKKLIIEAILSSCGCSKCIDIQQQYKR